MSFLTFAQLTISTSTPFIFVNGVLSLGMIASVAVEVIGSGALYYGAILLEYRRESFHFALCQRYIDSAERINGLDKAIEVDAHIVVDPYFVVLLYRVDKQLRSAVGVRRI